MMRVGSFFWRLGCRFARQSAAEIGAVCRCIFAASIAAATVSAARWIYARQSEGPRGRISVIGSLSRAGGAVPALSPSRAPRWRAPSATLSHLSIKKATVIHGRTQMQPFRGAFVAACAAVAAANNSLELVRDVALEDVPAGPRELHQRYSEIFRYGNRNAAWAICAEIKSARWRRG